MLRGGWGGEEGITVGASGGQVEGSIPGDFKGKAEMAEALIFPSCLHRVGVVHWFVPTHVANSVTTRSV